MKKLMLSMLLLVAAVLSVAAQNDKKAQDNKKVQDDNTGWFAGIGGGMNFGFDGQRYEDRATSHNGAGIGLDIYFGNWFSKWGGFRAGFQGLSISNQYTDFGKQRYEYLHADMLFRPHKNVIPYVHLGYARIDKSAFAGGLGLAFPIHVSRRISIVPDLKATMMSNRIYEQFRKNPAVTLSATLGLCVNLGKKEKKGPEIAVEPVTVIVPKTEIVHDTVTVMKVIRDTVHFKTEIREYHEVQKDEKIATISGSALFDPGSDVLQEQAKLDLQAVVDWMAEHPNVAIEVGGHTDSQGSEAMNRDLSLRRAQSVKNYLVSKGVKASLITVRGYGYSQPVATNETVEGRQQNRRIEIKVK